MSESDLRFNLSDLQKVILSESIIRDAADLAACLAPGLAGALGVADGDRVAIRQGGADGECVVRVDPRVAEPCVRLPVAVPGAERLGPAFGELSVAKV